MSRKLKIPAELVRTLRLGLHSELGGAASEIECVTNTKGREKHPDWYRVPLSKLDGVRALLDEIGWAEGSGPEDIDVDPVVHKDALIAALHLQAAVHDDMIAEAECVDRERAERGEPPKARATIARAEALAELLARIGLMLADTEDERSEAGKEDRA
ncbi:MAG: hypothetical protein ACRDK4_15010 [Solirubrobacteraceae bacterium]